MNCRRLLGLLSISIFLSTVLLAGFRTAGQPRSNGPSDKTAIIVNPFEWQYEFSNVTLNAVQNYLTEAGYNITLIANNSMVSIDFLKSNLIHGVIYWRGHGGMISRDFALVTGEEFDETKHRDLKGTGRLAKATIKLENGTTKDYFAVRSAFIDYYYRNHTFPNTLVYVQSCFSATTDLMANAFLNNGAGAYVGFKSFATAGSSWYNYYQSDKKSEYLFYDLCIRGRDVRESILSLRTAFSFNIGGYAFNIMWFYGDAYMSLIPKSGNEAQIVAAPVLEENRRPCSSGLPGHA